MLEKFATLADMEMDQAKLTPREIEVLQLMARGLTNHEIGKTLNVSTGTVNHHVHHVIRKLGVSNRTQAVAWAFRNGIAENR
jgi:DNA-binding NarL/FixJ family response regulator